MAPAYIAACMFGVTLPRKPTLEEKIKALIFVSVNKFLFVNRVI